MIKKIYLFRHAETNMNKNLNTVDKEDSLLNEIGIKQAKKNAIKLKDKGIEIIYSSPLGRTIETAQALVNLINVQIIKVDGLKEIGLGNFEKLTNQEIEKSINKDFLQKFFLSKDDGMDLRLPNGESKAEARERIITTVNTICEVSNYETIAISSHGFVLGELLKFYNFGDISPVNNCEIIKAEYDKGLKIIERLRNED